MSMTSGQKLGNTSTLLTTLSTLAATTLGLQTDNPQLAFLGIIGLGLMLTIIAAAKQVKEEVKASK